MKFLFASILLAASATIHLASGAEFGPNRALGNEGTDEIEYSTAEGRGKSDKKGTGKSSKGKSSKGKSAKGKSAKDSKNDGGYPSRKRQVSE